MNDVPKFTCHPDPLATGSIEPSKATCQCCGLARGFAYAPIPYGEKLIECLCPWCIADGSASSKLGASIADSLPLSKAGISRGIMDEVSLRTPGYFCWQQENWMACCEDACEFHGHAPTDEIRGLSADGRRRVAKSFGIPPGDAEAVLANYQPKGRLAIYKFCCRHCGIAHYRLDSD